MALLPVGYCGYLLLSFRGVSGEAGPIQAGLGPTMLGLGAVALFFVIPLLLKLVKLFAGAPSGGCEIVEESDFDPDAALARYLARKAAGGVDAPPEEPRPAQGSFGRKVS